MSIINEKYRNKYRGAGDWLKQVIDTHCYDAQTRQVERTDENGVKSVETVELKRKKLNFDKLFALADENGYDARGRFGTEVDKPNAPGRIRMSVGNSLRSVAKKNKGLKVNGEFVAAPDSFLDAQEAQAA